MCKASSRHYLRYTDKKNMDTKPQEVQSLITEIDTYEGNNFIR